MDSEWLKKQHAQNSHYRHRVEVSRKEIELQKIEHEQKEVLRLERLRDEFAMAALKSIINIHHKHSKEQICFLAYEIADAMMEARKK